MIDDGLLYKVASDYYVEKRNQQEIADELGVSRVQVSKYLKMAEERGLVRIEVRPPVISEGEQESLRREFRKKFAVKDILVCPRYSTPEATLLGLVRRAEEYLVTTFGSKPMTLGLAWGQTIYHFAEKIGVHERPLWRIVSLAGGSNRVSEKYFNMNYLVQALAERLQARSEPLYLPFFVSSAAARRGIEQDDEFERATKLWDDLDIVVTSVGSGVTASPLFQSGMFGERHAEKLRKLSCVGDMLAHFYDIDGNILDIGIESRIVNVSLHQLRRARSKIVFASGEEKADAVLGALNAKLVDVLIADQEMVNHLLGSRRL
jgi:DNA-binding transcriptional regulator LsrR (DeoR family)